MPAQPYDALLSIAASESDANQYYATGMLVPDPFIFLQQDGHTSIVLSDLEIERGKLEARVDEILPLSQYRDQLRQQGIEFPNLADITACLLREKRIRRVVVPGDFALQYADPLRERGFTVTYKDPFFETRMQKTEREIEAIRHVQQHNETAMAHAHHILNDADIGANNVLYYHGQVLTSEYLQRAIQLKLLEYNCLAQHTIVTSGDQATRPHEHGSGPLYAHQAIIIDIFPQSLTTRYFADITRTVVKGQASEQLQRLYAVVQAGQELGIAAIRSGVSGQAIHTEIQALFKREGFETGVIDGTVQGFIHGTGHGVGLQIHEAPRIGNADTVLHTGNVVTVEPGLYYTKIGGVRLEDLVVVTEQGHINLTTYPKTLELAKWSFNV